ncbi:hypothetical protein BCR37DRAFT_162115 [Protomyces lactucae-debilis]|uniref:Uncharacterized protein n=1 Tax=Protomyces lactucae-debilis TaxID=2754530 RepID=A0A1Y2EYB4_PROLT|nr:uncharacterized protein BCR37DRAFT_162115 [Protomyces lactucae-debilis]ORY76621.1 hypothetical protein BCR37DRAFT_162115 [Protomyces lactucae-debilis]
MASKRKMSIANSERFTILPHDDSARKDQSFRFRVNLHPSKEERAMARKRLKLAILGFADSLSTDASLQSSPATPVPSATLEKHSGTNKSVSDWAESCASLVAARPCTSTLDIRTPGKHSVPALEDTEQCVVPSSHSIHTMTPVQDHAEDVYGARLILDMPDYALPTEVMTAAQESMMTTLLMEALPEMTSEEYMDMTACYEERLKERRELVLSMLDKQLGVCSDVLLSSVLSKV